MDESRERLIRALKHLNRAEMAVENGDETQAKNELDKSAEIIEEELSTSDQRTAPPPRTIIRRYYGAGPFSDARGGCMSPVVSAAGPC